MGSGCVRLSPQQEVSNFKKLWLLAKMLESFKTTPSRGGPGRAGREEVLQASVFESGALGIISISPQLQFAPGSDVSHVSTAFTLYLES